MTLTELASGPYSVYQGVLIDMQNLEPYPGPAVTESTF